MGSFALPPYFGRRRGVLRAAAVPWYCLEIIFLLLFCPASTFLPALVGLLATFLASHSCVEDNRQLLDFLGLFVFYGGADGLGHQLSGTGVTGEALNKTTVFPIFFL